VCVLFEKMPILSRSLTNPNILPLTTPSPRRPFRHGILPACHLALACWPSSFSNPSGLPFALLRNRQKGISNGPSDEENRRTLRTFNLEPMSSRNACSASAATFRTSRRQPLGVPRLARGEGFDFLCQQFSTLFRGYHQPKPNLQ